ncbi:hypothetical protein Bpfe_030477, partial [Biomphalaria pfeifferi]
CRSFDVNKSIGKKRRMTNVTSNNETICSTTTEKFSSHLELVVVLAVFAVLIDVATAYFNLALIIALWRYTDPR